MSEDDTDEDTQWTAAARATFNTAGVDLLAAISAHINFFSSAELGTSWTEKNDLNEVVMHAAAAYADAQFDLTGNSGPFGDLLEWDDDEADDDDELPQPTSFISVLQRADYGVLDEESVLVAGRLKFLENRPGESEDNARSEVSHLGAALYELAHAEGWASLDKAPGLTAMGSIIQVIEPSEPIDLLDGPPETEEPDAGFSVDGRVLYTEQNQYF
ncbi:MAG: hypothetical protein V4531_12190 [Actinomycetota bacterium]